MLGQAARVWVWTALQLAADVAAKHLEPGPAGGFSAETDG